MSRWLFALKSMNFVVNNDEFCIKNDEFNDESCIKNDELCIRSLNSGSLRSMHGRLERARGLLYTKYDSVLIYEVH